MSNKLWLLPGLITDLLLMALIGMVWWADTPQAKVADIQTITPTHTMAPTATDWPTLIPPPTLVVPSTPGTCQFSQYWLDHVPTPAGKLKWDEKTGECWYVHSNDEFDMDLNSYGCGQCHDAFRRLYP